MAILAVLCQTKSAVLLKSQHTVIEHHLLCDWVEANSRRQKHYSEDSTKYLWVLQSIGKNSRMSYLPPNSYHLGVSLTHLGRKL